MIAIDLSKQQALNVDARTIQQINSRANLDRAEATMFFIIEEAKEIVLDFSQGTVKVLWVKYNSIKRFDFYQYKLTQCNSLNVKLSNLQLNKLKSAIKNKTEVVLRLSSNMIADNETNFAHKLFLTNRQAASLRKAFADKSSTDIKLSKTQIPKMIQSGWFLGRLKIKTGLLIIKNVTKPLVF